jgi:hypothetical protein
MSATATEATGTVTTTAATGTGTAPGSYDELVTLATVGLSRRQLPVSSGDPADALLGTAARMSVARRAGMLPVRGVTAPPPAPDDPLPELPARAGLLLRRVASDAELLSDLLMMALRAGYRAPAPLLRLLLDAAARTVALRPAVAGTLGSRGRWLAVQREDWRRVADAATTAPAGTAVDDPRLWETGTRAERVAYLLALRGGDPAAARELLGAGWAREDAEERGQLLGVLSRGLSAGDEELLEAALDDRGAAVRDTARHLLAALPGSAFNQRASQRGAAVLRLCSNGGRHWLEAAIPDGTGHDGDGDGPAFAPDDLARDGITAKAPAPGIGAGAWLLTQLVAAVPLGEWTRRWGLDAAQVVSLPVEGGLHTEIVAGWRLAAVRRQDREWAAALLSGSAPLLEPGRPEAAWPANRGLAAVLDPAARAALAPDVVARVAAAAAGSAAGKQRGNSAAGTVIAELSAWPGPWPDALADVVLRLAASSITVQGAARTAQGLLAAAARNIPVTGSRDYAASFIELAETPGCAYPWENVLRRTADTLALRRAFHATLESLRNLNISPI